MKTYRKVATVQAKIFENGDEDGMIHPMDGNAVMGDRVLDWYTLVPYIKTLENKRHEGQFGKHYLCVGVNGERCLVEKSIFEKTYVEEGNKAREYHSPLIQELMSNTQKSSVEWLIDQLDDMQYNPLEKNGYVNAKNRLLEKAKAMHKKEILEAYSEGVINEYEYQINNLPRIEAEEYYNETFEGSDEK